MDSDLSTDPTINRPPETPVRGPRGHDKGDVGPFDLKLASPKNLETSPSRRTSRYDPPYRGRGCVYLTGVLRPSVKAENVMERFLTPPLLRR